VDSPGLLPTRSGMSFAPPPPPEMPAVARHRLVLLAGLGVWLLAATSGLAVLWTYGTTAGTPADPPPRWPAKSRLAREAGRRTLVVFAHPHCPCTRASIEELDRLLASVAEPPQVHVLFTKPDGTEPAWELTDLWQRAAEIPGVSIARDEGGREAERFGVATSGQVLLYDVAGTLRFAGGITPSRGHAGDSAGRSMLQDLLASRSVAQDATPVFGCALHEAPS
jgi:hypothetical protein